MGQSATVYDISIGMLGPVGGILAIIGVVACPITSGDTAFRSARLIIAEIFNLPQKEINKRLYIAFPLFIAGFAFTQLNFDVLWRYFSWSNQTLAMLALAVFTSYLLKKHKNKFVSLITVIPCAFMGAVTLSYILMAEEGFMMSATIAYPVGIIFALAILAFYFLKLDRAIRISKGIYKSKKTEVI